ncbi:MAG: GIY-YIG nuclease family protein [Victivallales bacterium]|nr:GIY-YIG nuclease family protein [Victivallales bacterium]
MMTPEECKRFQDTLGIGPRSYYVYALCTDSGPFYIGKGKGLRILNHQDVALLAEESVNSDDTLSPAEKQERIRAMSAKLQNLIVNKEKIDPVIIKWGLTEHEAFMCESSLINLLKFCKGKTIAELTNIVNGHASPVELANSADVKTKARPLPLFLTECAVSQKDISELRGKVVLIKINTTYPSCFSADGLPDDAKIRDCVSGTWKINHQQQREIQYVFALYRGRVVGIYHISRISAPLTEEFQRHHCLPDFPTFPEEDRRIDRMVAQYATVEQARLGLSAEDFETFSDALSQRVYPQSRRHKTPQEVLDAWRRRSYYVLDKDVPQEVMAFMNTLVTLNGDQSIFQCETPLQYRF